MKALNARIALRFVLAKKRAMLMSLFGIVFGVSFFVVALAQAGGFEQFFRETIIGTNGSVRVQDRFQQTITSLTVQAEDGGAFAVPLREGRSYVEGIEHPGPLSQAVRAFSGVTGVSAVLRDSARASSGFFRESADVYGIELEDHLAVSSLESTLRFGSLQEFAREQRGALLGIRLAQRLNLSVGDFVFLEAKGETRRYRLCGIFETGVSDIDKVYTYIHQEEARRLFKKPFGASFLQVGLLDPDTAPEVARQLQFATGHYAASWQHRERTWLEVFRALRISSALTMSAILLIAGLGMFNTLAIIVMERRKEIAILRSMGYTRGDIAAIFLYQGLFVLGTGLLTGWLLAAALTWTLTKVPLRIRGIFSTDSFVVEWSLWHYALAGVVATLIVLVASTLPARRAARMEPGSVIRGMGA